MPQTLTKTASPIKLSDCGAFRKAIKEQKMPEERNQIIKCATDLLDLMYLMKVPPSLGDTLDEVDALCAQMLEITASVRARV